MIAFATIEPPCGEIAAEARRRVGGRALAVSEYASRLVEAICSLMELVEKHAIFGGNPPLSDQDRDQMIELDGRIEALRLRLGIAQIPIKEPETGSSGKKRVLGVSRIIIMNVNSDPDVFADPIFKTMYFDDWVSQMKSLKAIAQELAVAPKLDPEEQDIVELIVSVGHRLTTTQLLSEFGKRGVVKADSTIKGKLAQLTRRKVLVNRSDTSPKGYGLPEWD